jgi:hypothetical protein
MRPAPKPTRRAINKQAANSVHECEFFAGTILESTEFWEEISLFSEFTASGSRPAFKMTGSRNIGT